MRHLTRMLLCGLLFTAVLSVANCVYASPPTLKHKIAFDAKGVLPKVFTFTQRFTHHLNVFAADTVVIYHVTRHKAREVISIITVKMTKNGFYAYQRKIREAPRLSETLGFRSNQYI